MEIEDGNLSVLGLVHSPNQILKAPLRSGLASNRDKQRIVFRRVVRRTSGPVVPIGKFRSHPSPRKQVAFLQENLGSRNIVMKQRIGKCLGRRDPILLESPLNTL